MTVFFNRAIIILIAVCTALSSEGQTHDVANPAKARELIWKKIEPHFQVLPEYRGVMGDYRSPLTFYDGSRVRSKRDWNKRADEIRSRWHQLMGSWPALITDQHLQFLDSATKEEYTKYRVAFRWTPAERTEGYLLVPHGSRQQKMPAVITVFYEPETAIGEGREHRDFAHQLARRGFVTLSIGTSEASKARTYSLYYPNIDSATVQPLSMLAYAAANAWQVLSKVSYVDSTRIGIMGHSFGGKWAMFASCLYDKFACAVWSDPGIVFEQSRESINYWEPWYLGYHPKPWRKRGLITAENPAYGLYPRLLAEGYDLHELHALMAPRPFLVSGGAEDPPSRWIPLNHTLTVYNKLGVKNRVAMTNRPEHSPDENSNEQAYLFLEYFLK